MLPEIGGLPYRSRCRRTRTRLILPEISRFLRHGYGWAMSTGKTGCRRRAPAIGTAGLAPIVDACAGLATIVDACAGSTAGAPPRAVAYVHAGVVPVAVAWIATVGGLAVEVAPVAFAARGSHPRHRVEYAEDGGQWPQWRVFAVVARAARIARITFGGATTYFAPSRAQRRSAGVRAMRRIAHGTRPERTVSHVARCATASHGG